MMAPHSNAGLIGKTVDLTRLLSPAGRHHLLAAVGADDGCVTTQAFGGPL
jgi:hypothetical protein